MNSAAFLITITNISCKHKSCCDKEHWISKQTLVKTILLLSYTQMLVQSSSNQAESQQKGWLPFNLSGLFNNELLYDGLQHRGRNIESIFSVAGNTMTGSPSEVLPNIMAALLGGLKTQASGLFANSNGIGAQGGFVVDYSEPIWTMAAFNELWLNQLHSTTVQRLVQSILIQVWYIVSLIFLRDEDDDDDGSRQASDD